MGYEIIQPLYITKPVFDRLYEIEKSCSVDPTPILTREELVTDMSVREATNFFLEYNDEIVGYATVQDQWDKWYMSNSAILKEHRGKGWGKKLIEVRFKYIEKQCRGNKIYVHCAVANKIVVGMYKHFGFAEVDRFTYTTGEPGVELEKRIGGSYE